MGITVMAAATTPKSRGEISRGRTTRVANPLTRTVHFCAASQRKPDAARLPRCSCSCTVMGSQLRAVVARSVGAGAQSVAHDLGDTLLLLHGQPRVDG